MANEILNSLLKEYEHKRTYAELDLIKRKENLYKLIPEFQEIDDEINRFTISTAKNLLHDNNSIYLLDLNKKINELKLKKEQLLIKNGYNKFYLKPFYECYKCNDTGYIKSDNNRTIMCNCLKQKLLNISFNKSNISNLNKENFNTFNENIFSDEVDLAKYKLNISPRKNIINIKNKCIEFVENFDDINCKNLLFSGNTGLR
jgi:DNA replication protein DnaC